MCLNPDSYIFKIVRRIFTFLFARPSMQNWNDLILNLALHGRGYNNCCTFKATGEEIFLKILSTHHPKVCIDIGANIGLYSRWLLLNTNAKVYAFEPMPTSFQKLSELQNEFPGRLIAINEGVGNITGDFEIHFGDDDSELASFSKEIIGIDFLSRKNINSKKLPVTTLDSALNLLAVSFAEIDLLKIDTEGFEFEVLDGARDTILKFKPKFIHLEFNRHQLFKLHSIYLFSSMLVNYTCYQLLPYGKGLIKRDPRIGESNIYLYSNFVFVRSDITI